MSAAGNTLFGRTGNADFPDHLKCMIAGEPKSGKTSFLGTIPNIVVLDTEPQANNLQSIAHLNVPYATINTTADLEQAKLFLTDPSMRSMLAQQMGLQQIEAVAIDTLDTLQAILKRDRMKEKRQTQFLRDDWAWLKEEMTSIIQAFTALPMHVFFLVHTKTQELGNSEKGDGRTVVIPNLQGGIANEIAGMVGYSLLTFRRQDVTPEGKPTTSYYMRAEGDETYGFLGNRAAGELPDIIEPTFRTLKHFSELARTKVKNAPDVQVQTPVQTAPPAAAAPAPAAPAPAAAEPVVQNPDQAAPAPSAPAAPAPAPTAAPADRPEGSEPVNAAALSHIKKVYDALQIEFPEAHILATKTIGSARTLVKMWVAIQQDAANGKLAEGKTPQDEMLEFLQIGGWLEGGEATIKSAPVAVEPKVDGTIEQVKAYAEGDIAKVNEAYTLEIQKDKPRSSLLDWLVNQGAQVVQSQKAEAPAEVQTPVENEAPAQPVAEVTPEPEKVDAPPTEEQAIETVKEALGGEVVSQENTGERPCDECGEPVDDLDIANLSLMRYERWLCVTDYLKANKAS